MVRKCGFLRFSCIITVCALPCSPDITCSTSSPCLCAVSNDCDAPSKMCHAGAIVSLTVTQLAYKETADAIKKYCIKDGASAEGRLVAECVAPHGLCNPYGSVMNGGATVEDGVVTNHCVTTANRFVGASTPTALLCFASNAVFECVSGQYCQENASTLATACVSFALCSTYRTCGLDACSCAGNGDCNSLLKMCDGTAVIPLDAHSQLSNQGRAYGMKKYCVEGAPVVGSNAVNAMVVVCEEPYTVCNSYGSVGSGAAVVSNGMVANLCVAESGIVGRNLGATGNRRFCLASNGVYECAGGTYCVGHGSSVASACVSTPPCRPDFTCATACSCASNGDCDGPDKICAGINIVVLTIDNELNYREMGVDEKKYCVGTGILVAECAGRLCNPFGSVRTDHLVVDNNGIAHNLCIDPSARLVGTTASSGRQNLCFAKNAVYQCVLGTYCHEAGDSLQSACLFGSYFTSTLPEELYDQVVYPPDPITQIRCDGDNCTSGYQCLNRNFGPCGVNATCTCAKLQHGQFCGGVLSTSCGDALCLTLDRSASCQSGSSLLDCVCAKLSLGAACNGSFAVCEAGTACSETSTENPCLQSSVDECSCQSGPHMCTPETADTCFGSRCHNQLGEVCDAMDCACEVLEEDAMCDSHTAKYCAPGLACFAMSWDSAFACRSLPFGALCGLTPGACVFPFACISVSSELCTLTDSDGPCRCVRIPEGGFCGALYTKSCALHTACVGGADGDCEAFAPYDDCKCRGVLPLGSECGGAFVRSCAAGLACNVNATSADALPCSPAYAVEACVCATLAPYAPCGGDRRWSCGEGFACVTASPPWVGHPSACESDAVEYCECAPLPEAAPCAGSVLRGQCEANLVCARNDLAPCSPLQLLGTVANVCTCQAAASYNMPCGTGALCHPNFQCLDILNHSPCRPGRRLTDCACRAGYCGCAATSDLPTAVCEQSCQPELGIEGCNKRAPVCEWSVGPRVATIFTCHFWSLEDVEFIASKLPGSDTERAACEGGGHIWVGVSEALRPPGCPAACLCCSLSVPTPSEIPSAPGCYLRLHQPCASAGVSSLRWRLEDPANSLEVCRQRQLLLQTKCGDDVEMSYNAPGGREFDRLLYAGEPCWAQCGRRAGWCKFCAVAGKCCRQGDSNSNGCDAGEGGSGYHACTPGLDPALLTCFRYVGDSVRWRTVTDATRYAPGTPWGVMLEGGPPCDANCFAFPYFMEPGISARYRCAARCVVGAGCAPPEGIANTEAVDLTYAATATISISNITSASACQHTCTTGNGGIGAQCGAWTWLAATSVCSLFPSARVVREWQSGVVSGLRADYYLRPTRRVWSGFALPAAPEDANFTTEPVPHWVDCQATCTFDPDCQAWWHDNSTQLCILKREFVNPSGDNQLINPQSTSGSPASTLVRLLWDGAPCADACGAAAVNSGLCALCPSGKCCVNGGLPNVGCRAGEGGFVEYECVPRPLGEGDACAALCGVTGEDCGICPSGKCCFQGVTAGLCDAIAGGADTWRCAQHSTAAQDFECSEVVESDGSSYSGCSARTISGRTCAYWDTNTDTPIGEPRGGSPPHHFCRNPEGQRDNIWCSTIENDVSWDYCYPRTVQQCRQLAGIFPLTDVTPACCDAVSVALGLGFSISGFAIVDAADIYALPDVRLSLCGAQDAICPPVLSALLQSHQQAMSAFNEVLPRLLTEQVSRYDRAKTGLDADADGALDLCAATPGDALARIHAGIPNATPYICQPARSGFTSWQLVLPSRQCCVDLSHSVHTYLGWRIPGGPVISSVAGSDWSFFCDSTPLCGAWTYAAFRMQLDNPVFVAGYMEQQAAIPCPRLPLLPSLAPITASSSQCAGLFDAQLGGACCLHAKTILTYLQIRAVSHCVFACVNVDLATPSDVDSAFTHICRSDMQCGMDVIRLLRAAETTRWLAQLLDPSASGSFVSCFCDHNALDGVATAHFDQLVPQEQTYYANITCAAEYEIPPPFRAVGYSASLGRALCSPLVGWLASSHQCAIKRCEGLELTLRASEGGLAQKVRFSCSDDSQRPSVNSYCSPACADDLHVLVDNYGYYCRWNVAQGLVEWVGSAACMPRACSVPNDLTTFVPYMELPHGCGATLADGTSCIAGIQCSAGYTLVGSLRCKSGFFEEVPVCAPEDVVVNASDHLRGLASIEFALPPDVPTFQSRRLLHTDDRFVSNVRHALVSAFGWSLLPMLTFSHLGSLVNSSGPLFIAHFDVDVTDPPAAPLLTAFQQDIPDVASVSRAISIEISAMLQLHYPSITLTHASVRYLNLRHQYQNPCSDGSDPRTRFVTAIGTTMYEQWQTYVVYGRMCFDRFGMLPPPVWTSRSAVGNALHWGCWCSVYFGHFPSPAWWYRFAQKGTACWTKFKSWPAEWWPHFSEFGEDCYRSVGERSAWDQSLYLKQKALVARRSIRGGNTFEL